jgi:hypothetical protein
MRERGRRKVGVTASLTGCALTAIVVLGLAGPAGIALAAPQVWQIQKSPNATVPGGQLGPVSCSSADACTAVGTNPGTNGLNVTLAERWNGTSWRAQHTPKPAADTVPASSPQLLGVSCPSATFCEAVGGYAVGTAEITLAENWNGTVWTRQHFPAPGGSTSAFLDKISCTSAQFCEAVGSYNTSGGETLGLAAQWNGTSWSLQRIPHPSGATLVRMGAVSCASPSFCEAGGSVAGFNTSTFAEQWNGTSWHLQALPGTAGAGAVSCVSTAFCESVGDGGGDMWNGSSWSAQTIAGPAGSTFIGLSGVSCVTATFCEAVGQYNDSSGHSFSLATTWDGTSWTAQAPPNPATATTASLSGVSCAAVAACEAAGDFRVGTSNAPVALAEGWNGTSWQLQQAASPPGAAANDLSAVSCVSTAFCEAVGSRPDSSGATAIALAEVWNGATWQIQKTANPAQADNGFRMSLDGVSCVSPSFCEAVGSSSSTSGGGAEEWDGTAWKLQAIPGGPVAAVSCASATFCVAAGIDGHVDTWNGTSWSAQPSTTGFTSLNSVSCTSPSFCEATGFGPAGDEAEGWNGAAWSAQATPAPADGSSVGLLAVSCTGAQSCEAVGNYFSNSTFQQVTLAEVWNGATWAAQRTPSPAASFGSSLAAVSCTAVNSCTAVGQNNNTAGVPPLAEVWDGSAWHQQFPPSHPFAGENVLDGVSCGAASVCTAVGVTDNLGQVEQTFIETGD